MRDGDKVKMTRLHVLEHPHLHGKPASDPPIHVVWEPHEFDWWQIGPDRSLEIGVYGETYGSGQHTFTHRRVIKIISNGMYASAWEETTEYPDAIATASVDVTEADVDDFRKGFRDGMRQAEDDAWADAESGELSILKVEHADPTAEVISDAPIKIEVIRVESDEELPRSIVRLDRPIPSLPPAKLRIPGPRSNSKGMQGHHIVGGALDEIREWPTETPETPIEYHVDEPKLSVEDRYATLSAPTILEPPSSFFNAAPEPKVQEVFPDPSATRLDLETFKPAEPGRESIFDQNLNPAGEDRFA